MLVRTLSIGEAEEKADGELGLLSKFWEALTEVLQGLIFQACRPRAKKSDWDLRAGKSSFALGPG